MSGNVVKLDTSNDQAREYIADQLRGLAHEVETAEDWLPQAFAVVLFGKDEATGNATTLVEWKNQGWPAGLFAEAVKVELLQDIDKRGRE